MTMKQIVIKTIPQLVLSRVLSLIMIIPAMTVVHAQVKVVGYVSNNQVSVVDYTKITHLNIAFENPDVNGNLSFSANDNTYIQKAHDNGKKVLVSIAGGFASEDVTLKARYFDLISDDKREAFVQKISDYLIAHHFDGLDVDMEGGAINDDYGKFIEALSVTLKANDKLLTAALSHLNGGTKISDETFSFFDFVNIMAYDATGPWNPDNPGQHSSYDFAVTSLDYWTDRGLPESKAVLGVPFYGYGFGDDFNEGMAYSAIVNKYPGAEGRDESGNTIYYNGIPTIKMKAQYVVDHAYGGLMIWNLAQDLPSTNAKSLLRAINNVINNITTSVIDEIEIQDEPIQLFPNPVDEMLHINPAPDGETDKLDIIDPSGREFDRGQIYDEGIDVSFLPSGLYVLRLTSDNRSVFKKFVKR